MDVRCEHCGAEYEFDDALVSERGTSVKCTSCGHQFKVFRPTGQGDPERWVIRTYDGRDVIFHSIRDLKAAIMARQILRSDRLARGTGPARTLGTIPELASFFDDAERVSRGGATRAPTPMGLGGPPSQMPLLPERVVSRTWQGVAPSPHQVSVSMLPAEGSVPPPSYDPPTARKPLPPPAPVLPPLTALPPTPAPGEVHGRESELGGRVSRSDFSEDETAMGKPRNPGALRWVLAVVVLGALGVAGVTFGQQMLGASGRGGPAPSASAGSAIKDLLQQGERSLADGDLEGAKELFIKASALAEGDARVHVALSKLWASRADLAWLRLRLLPEQAAEPRAQARRELDDALGRARKAAARAAELAPEESSTVRVKMDTLRLADDLAVARALAPKLVPSAMQPDSAYVLAALDLSEASPQWKGVIERLQLAASGETSPGRARAALVYALVRSGDTAGARQELQRMNGAARPYPLLPELKTFVEGRGAPAGSASASSSAVDIGSLPPATPPTPPQGAGQGPAVPVAGGGEGRHEPGGNDFSQEELDRARRRLFGEQKVEEGKPETKPEVKPEAKPEVKPEAKPEVKPEKKPHIDTSDLPGVQ
ncbi:MAG: zinc-ribbon domain-containing protein [Polyangiaceae bacterium]|jgi:predicted Zn finger-like uncharacterized protein|nr:zinc-ribbon domain-containing protein [Polyangiaceae bacterium]